MALEAVNEHGGYRVMDVIWFRDKNEDMDADFDWIEESAVLHPTREAAEAAIAQIITDRKAT